MAIKNTRKSIDEAISENRLKTKLKEDFEKFLTEEDEEEVDLGGEEVDLGGEELGDLEDVDGGDLGDEGLEGEEAGLEDTDLDGTDLEDDSQDLTAEQEIQVDSWVDELLADGLEDVEIPGSESLDTEIGSDELDPMGEEQMVSDELPMSVDTLNNIIDSDESLQALEDELNSLAIEIDEVGVEGEEEIDGLEGEELEGEEELSTEDEELEESVEVEGEEITEGEDPFKGIDGLPGFEKGYKGVDVKDELTEGKKAKLIAEATRLLETEVKKTEMQESIKKSKMLVAAAGVILKNKNRIDKQKREIEELKLENYKLIKANGILSVAGEKLSSAARTQISEGFDKCGSIDQVNTFYNKLTESIKKAKRPTLNEAVSAKKTFHSVIKEAKTEEKEVISKEQARKNMLMGMPTENDAYFNF